MQTICINLPIGQNTSTEVYLDTLVPNEVLEIIFDQVVNQNKTLHDISSILLTCHKWKGILEKNPCIALVQNLFQLQDSPQSVIKHPLDCRITDQKNHFTSQELKLIDQAAGYFGTRFKQLLMINSKLFQSNSLFLSLLDRYLWDADICKESNNENIQQIAKEQLSILSSLASGTDDQILTVIKNDFIEKFYEGCLGQKWYQAKKAVICTLKKFPNFNDRNIFIKVARCFKEAVFDIHVNFKKDREIVLTVIQENGSALEYANESLQKDREIVLVAVQQDGLALEYANESLQNDRQIVFVAIQENGCALEFTNESLQKDREIVLVAVQQNGCALEFVNESLQNDREIVLAAVQQKGWALQYADESLKKDQEIVLAAVKQYGGALKYADVSLQNDREIVLAAVRQNGCALEFANESLQDDQEIVLAAVNHYVMAL